MGERIWTCKIGGECDELPQGADFPMRMAVQEAYRQITGRDCKFNFSGWNGTLTKSEREVAYPRGRTPQQEQELEIGRSRGDF